MLNNATCFKKVFIATGYSDLRHELEGLSNIICFQFHLDPMTKIIFIFFVGVVMTASRGSFGKAMDFCYNQTSKGDLIMAHRYTKEQLNTADKSLRIQIIMSL